MLSETFCGFDNSTMLEDIDGDADRKKIRTFVESIKSETIKILLQKYKLEWFKSTHNNINTHRTLLTKNIPEYIKDYGSI